MDTRTIDSIETHAVALVIVCVVQVVVVADANAMVLALPSVGRAFAAETVDLQWVLSGYSLCFGGFLVLGGRAADAYGGGRIVLVGGIGFALTSGVASLASSLPVLAVARSGQGLAAALLIPASLAVATTTWTEPHARMRALGLLGSMVAVGFVAGAVGGGWLTASEGWRAIPSATVPAAVAIALCGLLLVRSGERSARLGRPPIGSALLLVSAFAALTYPLSRISEIGWASPLVSGGVLVATGLLTVLASLERRSRRPLVPRTILRSRTALRAAGTALLTVGASGSFIFVVTLHLQAMLGYSATEAGLLFLAFGVPGLGCGALAPIVTARTGARTLLVAGLLIQATGALAIAAASSVPDDLLLMLGMGLVGSGTILAIVTFTLLAVEGTPQDAQGSIAGFLGTAQQLGAVLGLALVATITSDGQASGGLDGLHDGLAACGVMSLLAALIASPAWRA